MNEAEWQYIGDDNWVFGVKVRGAVRVLLAEIYFDEDCKSKIGGWHWMVYPKPAGDPFVKRGLAANRIFAIEEAEKELGILN